MKTVHLIPKQIIATLVVLALSISTYSQRPNNQGRKEMMNGQVPFNCSQVIPDLTESQKTEIELLGIGHKKEMLQLSNKQLELTAKLNSLRIADQVDMNAIDAQIEEMGKIRTEKLKKKMAHQQAIRQILSENQKTAFDAWVLSRPGKHGPMANQRGRGMGQGRGQCRPCPFL
jgi:Spy/CpxP family protein refolding chaperone